MQEHRTQWCCLEAFQQAIHTKKRFPSHLAHAHTQTVADEGLNSAVRNYHHSQIAIIDTKCSLCKAELPSLKQLRSHLGRHQRELSLFAIPSTVQADVNETQGLDSKSDGSSSAASEVRASKKPSLPGDNEGTEVQNDALADADGSQPSKSQEVVPGHAGTSAQAQVSWPQIAVPRKKGPRSHDPIDGFDRRSIEHWKYLDRH